MTMSPNAGLLAAIFADRERDAEDTPRVDLLGKLGEPRRPHQFVHLGLRPPAHDPRLAFAVGQDAGDELAAHFLGQERFHVEDGRRVVERSAVESGGTAGIYPNLLDKGQAFDAAGGEILEFRVRETANIATTDINFAVSVEPY